MTAAEPPKSARIVTARQIFVTMIGKVASLRDHVEQGLGRDAAKHSGVDYLRENFGVWP